MSADPPPGAADAPGASATATAADGAVAASVPPGSGSATAPPSPAAHHEVILYDGVCALCNGIVSFLIARDPGDRYRFAALQGDYARATLARHGKDATRLSTMYLVRHPHSADEHLLHKGRAALRAVTGVGGAWRLLGIFRLLPTFLLDAGYTVVAHLRYRLFGRYSECPIPPPQTRHKFLP